jgi:ABC-type spermidine/putrescine transport system permease subunit I
LGPTDSDPVHTIIVRDSHHTQKLVRLPRPHYRIEPLSLLRSLGLALVSTLAALILAYPIALCVPPAKRGRRLALLAAPVWTSEVLHIFAPVLLLANRGATNVLLRWLDLTTAPVQLLYGTGAVPAGMVYTVFLSTLLPVYAALDACRATWRRQRRRMAHIRGTSSESVGARPMGISSTFSR